MSRREMYDDEGVVTCSALLSQRSTGGIDETSVSIIGDTLEIQSRHLSNMHVTQKH